MISWDEANREPFECRCPWCGEKQIPYWDDEGDIVDCEHCEKPMIILFEDDENRNILEVYAIAKTDVPQEQEEE